MSRNWTIFFLALWIMLVPFLGLPGFWRTVLLVLAALVIAVLTLLDAVRKRLKMMRPDMPPEVPATSEENQGPRRRRPSPQMKDHIVLAVKTAGRRDASTKP